MKIKNLAIFVVTLLTVSGIFLFFGFKPTSTTPVTTDVKKEESKVTLSPKTERAEESLNFTAPSQDDKMRRYEYLMTYRIPYVKPGFSPVFIFRDPKVTEDQLVGSWNGSGVAMMDGDTPKWVISAQHCFTHDGIYYITIITPDLRKSIWGIEQVYPQGTNDVVLAKVGLAKRLDALPALPGVSELSKDKPAQISPPNGETGARSLITGERFAIIGYSKAGGENPYYILDYSCTRAESGSGFLMDDGSLLIVNQFAGIDAVGQRIMGLDPTNKLRTLATKVNIKWPK